MIALCNQTSPVTMGRSAKFYKKPSLKEKQALSAAKPRSTASSDAKEAARDSAIKRSAESAQKRLAKAKERLEAEMAKSKPHFRLAGKVQEEEEEEVDMQDDDGQQQQDADKPKRRPRRRQRRDYGPMPKDMGIDYLAQWDSRAK